MIAPAQSETTNAFFDASGTVNLALLRYLNVIDAILFPLWCIIERSELYYSAVQVEFGILNFVLAINLPDNFQTKLFVWSNTVNCKIFTNLTVLLLIRIRTLVSHIRFF